MFSRILRPFAIVAAFFLLGLESYGFPGVCTQFKNKEPTEALSSLSVCVDNGAVQAFQLKWLNEPTETNKELSWSRQGGGRFYVLVIETPRYHIQLDCDETGIFLYDEKHEEGYFLDLVQEQPLPDLCL